MYRLKSVAFDSFAAYDNFDPSCVVLAPRMDDRETSRYLSRIG